nr:ECF transporter S component [Natranaerovirga pectinivora]
MNSRQLAYMGLFIALSFVGAQIKIQGSVAFDSMPAFLVALIISPVAGGIVGILGHMLTAVTSGFPLTLPIHMVVGVLMGITCYLFGYLSKKGKKYIAVIVAFLLNGPISLGVSAYIMYALGYEFAGVALFSFLIVPLSIAAILNIVIAVVVEPFLIRKKY